MGAVAVELVHLASLYHDDVMDEATVRRNVESVNARFGNLVAIVAGDFLLARSAEIAAGLGTEIAGLLAATLGELCQGQVAEVHAAFQPGRSRDDYYRAIAGKTASLMATSCRIGALTGGLPRTQIDAFTDFGRSFGMIFQVRDDILDVIGTEAELGKPAGQDLAEGIYTLPVLLALADPEAGPELRTLLGQPLGTARAGQGPGHRGRIGGHRRLGGGGPEIRRRGRGGGAARVPHPSWQPGSPAWPTPWWTTCPPTDPEPRRGRSGRPTDTSTDRSAHTAADNVSAHRRLSWWLPAPTRCTWRRWPPWPGPAGP